MERRQEVYRVRVYPAYKRRYLEALPVRARLGEPKGARRQARGQTGRRVGRGMGGRGVLPAVRPGGRAIAVVRGDDAS